MKFDRTREKFEFSSLSTGSWTEFYLIFNGFKGHSCEKCSPTTISWGLSPCQTYFCLYPLHFYNWYKMKNEGKMHAFGSNNDSIKVGSRY